MKRVLVVFMAMALVIVMTGQTMAESNFSITGEYVIQAFSSDGVASQNDGSLTTDGNDKRDYIYQRFRVQPQFKVSENVTANLRFDFAEGIWGQDESYSTARAAYGDGNDIQVDRAYVDLDMEWVRLKTGLQFFPVGQGQVFRDNQPGFQFNINTGIPIGIRLGWIKTMEGIGTGSSFTRLSDEEDENEDQDRYLAVLSYGSDIFYMDVFGVMQTDGGKGDSDEDGIIDNYEDEPMVYGLYFRGDAGAFSYHGEVAQFGGDNGNNVDYTGTQINLNGMYELHEKLKMGLDLFYSSAQGDNEEKITCMGDPFASLGVVYGGTFGWDMQVYGRANGHLYSGLTAGAGALPGDVFDPFYTGAGSIGAGIGAMWTPMEKMGLIGQLHYMTAVDDDLAGVTGEFEKGYNLLFAAVYEISPKTSLHATYERVDADFMDNRNPDASNLFSLWLGLYF